MGEQQQRWTLAATCALVATCALAFALRVTRLGFQSLWRDEVDAIRFAARPLGELLRSFTTPGENGPLFYLVLRPWLAVVGDGEFALRFFSVALGVLAVPLVFRLARRLFPSAPVTALAAALLAATSPYLVWYGQEGKMYALVVVLVLLSMERFVAAMQRGGWYRWLGYVVATAAAFYVHLVAIFILPVQVIGFFLFDRPVRRARRKPWLASLAVLVLPYLPMLAWQVPLLLEQGETGFRFVPLHDMLASLLANYSLGVVPGGILWTVGLFVALLLAAVLYWRDEESSPASIVLLLCWLVVPVAGLFAVSLLRPLYTARYLMFVLPAYLLLLAAGVAALGRRAPLLAGLVLGAILVVNSWGLWRQASTPLKADFRAATRYVSSRLTADDLLLFQIPYGRHSFDYYIQRQADQLRRAGPRADDHRSGAGALEISRGDYQVLLPLVVRGGGVYRWAEGLYTNSGMEPGEVDRQMAELVAGSQVVWLVETEAPMWDERGLVREWLDDHLVLTDEAHFVRVGVFRYELP
jgi:4-amino-4-deoxy-L-arabinose transferase-like glycosyltransferase